MEQTASNNNYAYKRKDPVKLGDKFAIKRKNMKELEEKVVLDTLMKEPTSTVNEVSKQTGITKTRVNEIMQSNKFTDILDRNGLSDDVYAQALTSKFHEHFAQEAGKDGDFPKYAEMIGRMKGVFQQKIDVSLDEKPKSLELVKNIINGTYEQTGSESNIQDTDI